MSFFNACRHNSYGKRNAKCLLKTSFRQKQAKRMRKARLFSASYQETFPSFDVSIWVSSTPSSKKKIFILSNSICCESGFETSSPK